MCFCTTALPRFALAKNFLGHDAAERACAAGAVEASLGLLRSCDGEGPLLLRTVEALWYMVDDCESCQRIMDMNGHQLLCRLARKFGQENPDAAGAIFRLLAETLYSEPRSSQVWGAELDAHLLASVIKWAVQEAGCSDPGCSTTLGFVCDVTALWLQRVRDKEAVKPLIGTVPQILKTMAFRLDDALLLQHGFRLLWAFGQTSTEWPEALRQPAVCALEQLRVLVESRKFYAPGAEQPEFGDGFAMGGQAWYLRQSPAPNAVHYNAMALQAQAGPFDLHEAPDAATCECNFVTCDSKPIAALLFPQHLSLPVLRSAYMASGAASGAASAVASAASAATSAALAAKERAAQVAPAPPDVVQFVAEAGEVVAEAGQRVRGAAGEVTNQVAGVAGHASTQVAAAVEGVRDQAVHQKLRIEQLADQFADLMEGFLKRKVFKLLSSFVDKIPGIVKTVLEDPEMPARVQRAQDAAIDVVWPDVREEIMWELAVAMDGKVAQDVPKVGSCTCCSFLRYHLYPFDRGFWGRLRDPVWILFTIVGLLPVYGISPAIFVFIFMVIDKTDEFQLVSFILQFKGFQYLTQGVLRSLMGYFMYLNCVTAPGQREDYCATNGPGSVAPSIVVLVGYFVQIVLVWIAFALLPFSSRKGRTTLSGHLDAHPDPAKQRGGYILYLLWYDLLTFVFCAGALVYVLQLREWLLDDWMVKHAFFAIQMVHGYLSMPFFFFTIPLVRNVLTHTAPTGYDRSGLCRQYVGVTRIPKASADRSFPRLFEKAEAARVLANLKRLMAGLQVRALDAEEQPSEVEAEGTPGSLR
ncbi:unnamed protein product [Symbiodinium natans]|uniref:Uncharacterized protein n=1 Tax=Symbiodinium natans TaxID=878477 RepID=A0A812UE32_9DINO|nr:unnamed protein product [Symbiodinium natans]